MKKTVLLIIIIAASFLAGYAFKTMLHARAQQNVQTIKKATGIGGIFFKCKDPKKLREWYQTNLGLNTNQYGCVFEWYQGADSTQKGFTQWSPFKETTKYFEPSTKEFMINYRVQNIDALLAQLKAGNITILDTVQAVEYGKFVHILDLEGNKVELWEPNDKEYEKMGLQMGAQTTK